MANDISFESSHRAGYRNIFFEFFRYILTNVQKFENFWVEYSIRRNDGREEGKMIDRWSWWQRGEILSVSDHEGQTVEEFKCEFCILGEILWGDKLDPVMDPKQKHASASHFCFTFRILKP